MYCMYLRARIGRTIILESTGKSQYAEVLCLCVWASYGLRPSAFHTVCISRFIASSIFAMPAKSLRVAWEALVCCGGATYRFVISTMLLEHGQLFPALPRFRMTCDDKVDVTLILPHILIIIRKHCALSVTPCFSVTVQILKKEKYRRLCFAAPQNDPPNGHLSTV